MTPKPHSKTCLRDKSKRLPVRKKSAMTIAIGTYFADRCDRLPYEPAFSYRQVRAHGFILCADTKIVASDGVTTYGTKLNCTQSMSGEYFAIANASEDGNAADSLAHEILTTLVKSVPGNTPMMPAAAQQLVGPSVKKVMTEWHKSYTQSLPPSIQFILGCAGDLHHSLYFCEPPSTVLAKSWLQLPITIGTGGRAIDPLLDTVFTGDSDIKQTLIRLAYLMYRAKKDQARDCGGNTDVLVIKSMGSHPFRVTHKEMARAEAIAPEIDRIILQCLDGLLSQYGRDNQEKFKTMISEWYSAQESAIAKLEFPSLQGLELSFSHQPPEAKKQRSPD